MNRRSLLATMAASISLSGCSGLRRFNPLGGNSDPSDIVAETNQSTPEPTPTLSPTTSPTSVSTDSPTTTETETPTPEPFVTETPFNAPRLDFGTFATVGKLNYTVTEQNVSKTFFDTYNKNRTVAMPDGRRLMTVHVTIKNDSEVAVRPHDDWVVLLNNRQYIPRGSFQHPDYTSQVNVNWLRRSWGRTRITVYTDPLAPGGSSEYWMAFVIPDEGIPTSVMLKEPGSDQIAARWSLYS